ncbi:MAG: phytoene desaturase [Alphaproteobacteria bacterium]|nr:phytoene desaturase [Alphaproteobacteria bacterium]
MRSVQSLSNPNPSPPTGRPAASADHVVVVGAGVGGLCAAVDLARRGFAVTLLERAERVGGKVRTVSVDGHEIDAGPTVLTMRHVFDGLFADAGARLDERLRLVQADVLARHAWTDGPVLDLHAHPERSRAAIAAAFGPREAEAFDRFRAHCAGILAEVQDVFIHAQRPGFLDVARTYGLSALGRLSRIDAHRTVWAAVQAHFREPRLQQLFGRYATYTGASPFQAPGTLNLIAAVEQAGVWYVAGGMHQLARSLRDLAEDLGVVVQTGAQVAGLLVDGGRCRGVALADGARLSADAVVLNADVSALADGRFGAAAATACGLSPTAPTARSLSALTLSIHGRAEGFPLVHHNVFFSDDYRAEFDAIFERRRLPQDPTVYLCAQDRKDEAQPVRPGRGEPERLFLIVNAPARGDDAPIPEAEVLACRERTLARLQRCGLQLSAPPSAITLTRPRDFEALFPGTGGALYGKAAHSWRSSFERSAARTRLPGLYLAGGSVHPGAGIPMVAISGRLAADALAEDFPSTSRSPRTATRGGTSTSSRTMGSTA